MYQEDSIRVRVVEHSQIFTALSSKKVWEAAMESLQIQMAGNSWFELAGETQLSTFVRRC